MKRWMLFLSLCLIISAGCSATPPAATMPPSVTVTPAPTPTRP